jgi:predicted nucleotidyltransferase
MNKYSGTITINGKKYKVERIDDIPYVDGKTIDEFTDEIFQSDKQAVLDLAKLGKKISEGRKIRLFGSRITGGWKDDSDLDVAILDEDKENEEPFFIICFNIQCEIRFVESFDVSWLKYSL